MRTSSFSVGKTGDRAGRCIAGHAGADFAVAAGTVCYITIAIHTNWRAVTAGRRFGRLGGVVAMIVPITVLYASFLPRLCTFCTVI